MARMAAKGVPKVVVWFPFGRYVTFPGEEVGL